MGLNSVADQIDFMELRYGQFTRNTTTARANLLLWLQAAEQQLWAAAPWTFREETISSFSFVAGTNAYNLESDTAQVLTLRNKNGDEMRKIPWRTYQRYYLNTTIAATVGTPTRWAHSAQETPDQFMTIIVWPTPDSGDEVAEMTREKRAAVLADAASSFSGFPEGLRMGVTLMALKNIATHEGKTDLIQLIQADVDQFIQGLAGRDREIMEGRL